LTASQAATQALQANRGSAIAYLESGSGGAYTNSEATTAIDDTISSLVDSISNSISSTDVAGYFAYMTVSVTTGLMPQGQTAVNYLLYGADGVLAGDDYNLNDSSAVYSAAAAAYANPSSVSGSNSLAGSTHTAVTWASVIDTNLMSVSSTNVIGSLEQAVNFIATARASMGAQQSRLEKTSDALLTYQDNLESAKSKISDIDMASETTKYSTYNVLTQSANAMLAQSNQLPQSLVLSLLQG
jgi:flagellin